MKTFKWEKRWNFSNALYCEDFVISLTHFPSPMWHVEQVAPNGVTIRRFGSFSNVQAAQYVAEAEMKKRIK